MSKKPLSDTDNRLAHVTQYQRALTSFSRVAADVIPIERLLHHATALVSGVTHIRHVKVLRYRPDAGDLLLEAGVGWKPGYVGTETFSLDSRSPPGRTMQTGTPVMVEDLPNDKQYKSSPMLREHGIISVLNVPVRIDGRTWGVLEVDTDEPHSFDSDDVSFLATVANILGVALLRQETKEKADHVVAECQKQKTFYETVISEFQHRVKNNLQTIIAFLSMQQRQTASDEDRTWLVGLMDRVHAIALAQDQLTFREGVSNVEFGDYLRALCANIDPRQDAVSIEVDVAQNILLPLDRAVPAGLIVNELVTNALKYAFDEKGGVIRITFSANPGTHEALLTVEDNGRGMGEPRKGGMGLRLIEALSSQLEGQLDREPVEKGTRMCVRFALPL